MYHQDLRQEIKGHVLQIDFSVLLRVMAADGAREGRQHLDPSCKKRGFAFKNIQIREEFPYQKPCLGEISQNSMCDEKEMIYIRILI